MTATFYVGDACDCVEGCQLADRFTPATRELMVFTKSAKRYFDLDAVREPQKHAEHIARYGKPLGAYASSKREGGNPDRGDKGASLFTGNPGGTPPLDWWQIPSSKPQPITEYEGDPMTATFYVGDAIEVMNKLPEKSVDLVLTSPPFLALRSYLPADHPDKALEGGSQATPGLFIDWLIDVVEACDRVLAPHGSLCIELGDTYAGSGGGGGDYYDGGLREGQPGFTGSEAASREALKAANAAHWRQKNPPKGKLANYSDARGNPDGMRDTTFSGGNTRTGGGTGWPLAKSLSLIPELFRFTLVYGFNPLTGRQTERWRLRNVVRWVRPNPPVGALGDKFRPATSELMVFCKSAKRYFDLDAVRQEPSPNTHRRNAQGVESRPNDVPSAYRDGTNFSTLPIIDTAHPAGAPPLDWWNIPPGGYEGAHYAVFPPELCIKPIKAMCPEKVCRVCGEPSRRITEPTPEYAATFGQWKWGGDTIGKSKTAESKAVPRMNSEYVTTGWSDCSHDDWRPGLVLDPFGGSGTTALVATGHGRDCILIDLDERNFDLALQRVGPFILERAR